MFTLVEQTAEKRKLQKRFRAKFQSTFASQGKRLIGFPGDSMEMPLFSNASGDIWYSYCLLKPVEETEIPKYWNAFGFFDPRQSAQTITVELNIPIDTNKQLVAGFFVRDAASGVNYLMHTGKVG